MAEFTVSSVAQSLGGLLMQEADFLSGVGDQIDNIYGEMMQMQCFLRDADARQHESESVCNFVADIRDLAYNVEDIIEAYVFKAKYASIFNPKKYVRLHQIGKEIKTLQSNIKGITRRANTYDFTRIDQGKLGTSSTTKIRQQLRQSYPHYDDEDVTGIEGNLKILVAELINNKGPRMVSIVGMGGLGKTTIAKKVYNHNDVKSHFDCHAWSFISQQFQVKTILQDIIMEVTNQTGLEMSSVQVLMDKLHKLLEDKCYLVVLDDIWSKDAWYALKPAFPKGKMGSKIMLTTRIKEVALCEDPFSFLHELACLTVEQSWELFCKKAFPRKYIASTSTSSSSYLSDVEENKKEKLGRHMLRKCGGLPLAVVLLGGLLATKQSIREWEMVSKDIGRYLSQPQEQQHHGVWWILSLSYHDLPFYLKPCFLYLGLYPEDTVFHKRELIQIWIAEGFVQQSAPGTTMEEMAEEYLVELINRSMVQVGERSFRGKVKKCRLHDLMRDLCLQKAKEENFLCIIDADGCSTVGDSSSTSVVRSISNHRRIRRHAIHFNCDRYVFTQQSTRNRHLRAVSLWKLSNPNKTTVGTLKFVCKEFEFLRVLVLENIEIDSLPRAIGKLIHLRYMRFIGITFSFTKVPTSIGNLRSLQFLTIRGAYRIPNVIRRMEQLTYCCISNTSIEKPFQVDGLKNLSTLELPVRSTIGYDASTLPNLRKLFLKEMDGNDCKLLHKLSISKLDRLQCLTLEYDLGLHISDDIYWSPLPCCHISADFDWSPLSCCHSLWKLKILGELSKLPNFHDFPPNLTKLLLCHIVLKESPIPLLEMLPNLESLTLHWTRDTMMTTKFYFSAKGFGKLQFLQICGLNLEIGWEVEKGALPCLMHLRIKSCELRMIPEGLRFITSLKKLKIINMLQSFNKRLQEDGDDWHKIQHIPSIIIQ